MRADLESDPPTVPLTFDLEYEKLMSGHPVAIETAATDFDKLQDLALA